MKDDKREFDRQTRNSGFELLRIISMILIIAHHYAVHGFSSIEMEYSINRYIVGILSLGGKLGVSLFILISSYFMVYSRFTLYKLVKLVGEILFYTISIGLLFLFILTPVAPLGIEDYIKMCFPIGFTYYGFMTRYIVLMLLSPILNSIISKMDKEIYRNTLMLGSKP